MCGITEHSERRIGQLASELEERVIERTDELERERALLASVIEQMPAAALIAEAPSGRLIVANEMAYRILGDWINELETMEGFAGREGYRPDGTRYEADEWPLVRAIKLGETVGPERIEVVTGDDRHVLDISAAPVRDRAGRIRAGVTIWSDVTAQERQERAERDFVTNAAHELQSPLAGITSAIEVLQAGAKEGPDRDVFLGHIEHETKRLSRLARALLTLARAQTAVESPRAELLGVHEILGEVAGELKPADGVEVDVECDADLGVLANRELLEQALSNLAGNSAKHTLAGRIELAAHSDDGHVEIRVADTGPGIPEDSMARVFERFYRADGDGHPGFGLGLAIARASVDAMQGELQLESTHRGTVARLVLPAAARLR